MKRLTVFGILLIFLWGCAPARPQTESKQYTATFLELFDTVTTVVGKAPDPDAFTERANQVRDRLTVYHRLFDIYNSYEGLHNLKTVNDQAGIAPVAVDGELMALLEDCMEYYTVTQGRVNVAMGAVLSLWHDARTQALNDPANGKLPDPEALREAAEHCDPSQVILDKEAGTVYIADPRLSLDVGAIGKGWAVERVARSLPEGLLISVGGNVVATGPKAKDTPWVVGIQDPDGGDAYLHTVYLSKGAVVTSGDYQRVFVVEGNPYHHIIDPQTLQPGNLWRSVSIVCPDSGVADMLSTALFLLPKEAGQLLLDRFGAQALWVDAQGNRFYSPGFYDFIRT